VNEGADQVTLVTGFDSGGNPELDATARYLLLPATYSEVFANGNDEQVLGAFQADSGDGKIEDLITPNIWGSTSELQFEDEDGTELPEFAAADLAGDGKPLTPAHTRIIAVTHNNLLNYKGTPLHLPDYSDQPVPADIISGTDLRTLRVRALPLGFWFLPAGYRRMLRIAIRVSADFGDDLTIRITSSKRPPRGGVFTGADFQEPFRQIEFTHTGDTGLHHLDAQEIEPVLSNTPGVTFLTVQGYMSAGGEQGLFAGVSELWLGPLEAV
jgi:hypothetical protein